MSYQEDLDIFYDKIKKAKRNKQIPKELCNDIDVYRYEITLNKQKINYLFSSTNINSIDETDIINYFKGKVQKGIENLTKQINISIKKTQKALEEADIVITATGNRDIISGDDFKHVKDGCMLANSGHFNVEINENDLASQAIGRNMLKPDIEEFVMADGRSIYLLAGGRLVNLAGQYGQGHPAEIMDLSFAMQALSAKRLLNEDMKPGVYKTRDEVDIEIAKLKLKTMGVEIDTLSDEQEKYMNSWDVGT